MFNNNTHPFYRLKAALIITLAFLTWEKLHTFQPASFVSTDLQLGSKVSQISSKLFCRNERSANLWDFQDCAAKPTFDPLTKNATTLEDADKILPFSSLY